MAEEPAPELTEAQQAKLAAKQFKAESRKLAKALKGKKPDPKLEAIDRCREDGAFLARGDCLVPLLQQCVFKKTKKGDNADVVQAALSCARAFLEAVPESQPDEEEGAATPEPPRLLLFESREKKNKLRAGSVCRFWRTRTEICRRGGLFKDGPQGGRARSIHIELARQGPRGALVHTILAMELRPGPRKIAVCRRRSRPSRYYRVRARRLGSVGRVGWRRRVSKRRVS